MGHTIWVEIHGTPLKETADDSSVMHRLMDHLDALAVKLGVQKLSDFYDYSELEDAYGDLGGEAEEQDGEDVEGDDANDQGDGVDLPEPTLEERQAKGEWFDSAAGLDSVRKLRLRIAERFDDLGFKLDRSTAKFPEQLMDELTHTEALLAEAASCGQRFRLLIVP